MIMLYVRYHPPSPPPTFIHVTNSFNDDGINIFLRGYILR